MSIISWQKTRPILFSTNMVIAILEGKKEVTRRTSGLETINESPDNWELKATTSSGDFFFHNKEKQKDLFVKSKYGNPGDLLWVRETWAKTIGHDEPIDTISYKAGAWHRDFGQAGKELPKGITLCEWQDEELAKEVKWKPSIHMKKEYTRIWLQIKNVKV